MFSLFLMSLPPISWYSINHSPTSFKYYMSYIIIFNLLWENDFFISLKICKIIYTVWPKYINSIWLGSSYGWADSVMDSHTTGPGSKLSGYGTLSTKLLTTYHNDSIIKLSTRWCVWKVGEGFPNQAWPKTLE